jgi:dolichol-phosphate mannosyltransferase
VTPVSSVVVPVFNERETLRALIGRLLPVLEEVTDGSFEVIFVDDGSSDGSSDILDAMHAEDRRMKVVHLSRNFGHQAALQAGIDAARGRSVVLMDADLQDRPEDLRAFFARWRDGYDVAG